MVTPTARNQIFLASQDEISLTQQPVLGVGSLSVLPIVNVPAFVNSGILDVDYSNVFNVEAAASVGRALIQSEYRWNVLNLSSGEEATVQAGYATVPLRIDWRDNTIQSRNGVFGRVKPNNPIDIGQGH